MLSSGEERVFKTKGYQLVCGRVGDRFLPSTCPQFQGFVPLKTQEGARKIYKNGKR
jgi:hypothetical protein